MKFSGQVGNGPMKKIIKLAAIRIADPNLQPYRDTDETCLGGGMHYPTASG